MSKGPYAARHGDFATAGALELGTRDRLDQHLISLGGGSFGTYRAVVGLSPELDSGAALLGAEVYGSSGPFERSESLTRVNLFGKVKNALHYDRARERLTDVVDAELDERAFGLYTEQRVAWASWLTSITGARYDRFGFAVNDALEQTATLGTRTSGARETELISPKATLVFSPRTDWDIFNFGLGYHSNDARGVVRGDAPVTPLTRATGGELGTRFRAPGGVDVGLSLFALDLDSEIVWVGDEGSTEARGPTRRLGAEAELRMAILPWLVADADGTLTRATFVDAPRAVNAVPLAPRPMLAGGLSARHPSGAYGRIGSVYLVDRPATEDRFLTAAGFLRVDATLGYRTERFELGLAAQNLFDAEWREAQFANVSRLSGETSCPAGTRAAGGDASFAGCEDVHFTPGTPFNLQANASWFF